MLIASEYVGYYCNIVMSLALHKHSWFQNACHFLSFFFFSFTVTRNCLLIHKHTKPINIVNKLFFPSRVTFFITYLIVCPFFLITL